MSIYMETNLLIRFALFCDDDHRVADDLVTNLVALLENLHDAAALLPFGGGDLLSAELSPAGKALTLCQCLHYALTRPGVASVMSGARNLEELKASIAYETATEEERDYAAAFAALPKISWVGHCMYCGHCAPCPVGIDVAGVTKFLNLARAQGELPETVREHYAVLPHHGGECISCGACEKRCPFGVPVMENMRRAAEVFGN